MSAPSPSIKSNHLRVKIALGCSHQLTTFKRNLMEDDRAFCFVSRHGHGFPPICSRVQNRTRHRDSQKTLLSPTTPPRTDTDEPPVSASEQDPESTSVEIHCVWRSVEKWRAHARGRSQRERRGAYPVGSGPIPPISPGRLPST